MAAPTVSSDNRAWIRQQTNGATGWSDDQLNTLAQTFLCTATDGTQTLDLWATAAMVMQYKLLALVDDPRGGAVQIRTGDAHVNYAPAGGGGTRLLRSVIKRYWNRSCPENRPSGWRTLDVDVARRYRLFSNPLKGAFVVNGPGPLVV